MRAVTFAGRFLVTSLVTFGLVGCGGDGTLPTGPSPVAAPAPASTRVVSVSGNLSFGDVALGSAREATMTIRNSGNAPLTVASLSVSGGLASQVTASWTSGQIGAGSSQNVLVRFQPTTAGTFNGTVTVNADHTGGSNTMSISGNAVQPNNATGNWSGSYVIERCDGTGSTQDYFCSSRGAYPVGSSLPLRLNLTQTGGNVSGTWTLGQVTGPVNGSISSGGDLTLSGTASASGVTARITFWGTRVVGNAMSGNFNYDASFTGIPGVAAIRARLIGLNK